MELLQGARAQHEHGQDQCKPTREASIDMRTHRRAGAVEDSETPRIADAVAVGLSRRPPATWPPNAARGRRPVDVIGSAYGRTSGSVSLRCPAISMLVSSARFFFHAACRSASRCYALSLA